MAGIRSAFTLRTLLLGVASWLAPFVFSFLSFDRGGELAIPEPLFKSIMIVVFGGFGAYLLVLAYKHVPPTALTGWALGTFWFVINLALDVLVLLPMTKMPLPDYAAGIGLRYLLIPIMAAGMGHVAGREAAARA